MHKSIRSIAMRFALLMFFVMAVVGWFCGQSPPTCCRRAILGAIATYICISIAANMIVKIVINQMIRSKLAENQNTKP